MPMFGLVVSDIADCCPVYRGVCYITCIGLTDFWDLDAVVALLDVAEFIHGSIIKPLGVI